MKQFRIFLIGAFTLFVYNGLSAQQPSLGLLKTSEGLTNGYVLFTPQSNKDVYLIDNCGGLVNEWNFGEVPGAVCYLLDNGNLLRAGRDTIEIRDWDDNRIWFFALGANLGLNQHHDIEPLPNGNILCLVRHIVSSVDAYALGKDTAAIPGNLQLSKVIELQPIGLDSAAIVWEWRFADHFIQDVDNLRANFGVVADHSELIDINYPTVYSNDFTHCNAIEYNADLDQILISARSLDEILIIDHSTTTAEASGHSGGNTNKGGDFLFRWGNPLVYQQGTSADQKLFIQHDPKWIPNGYLDAGKITIYSNGGDSNSSNYSSLVLINPSVNSNGSYNRSGGKFIPLDYEWTWHGEILGDTMREGKMSGLHALPNGNMVTCETSKGQVTELTRAGEVLWVYKNPRGNLAYFQFDTVPNSNNSMFRAEKYPADFVGFQGKDLTSVGILEGTNAISDTCNLFTALINLNDWNVSIQNPVEAKMIRFSKFIESADLLIYDLQGKVVMHEANFEGNYLSLDLSPGVYQVQLKSTQGQFSKRIMIR